MLSPKIIFKFYQFFIISGDVKASNFTLLVEMSKFLNLNLLLLEMSKLPALHY